MSSTYASSLTKTWEKFDAVSPPAYVWVTAITVVALGLRLYTLPRRGVPTDEAITMWFVTRLSYAELALEMPKTQPHYPTYYLLLKSWLEVTVSEAPLVARLPSVIAGTAMVPLGYAIANELADKRAGVFAAAFIAVSPFFIGLSQLIRMYALFTFFIGASWWLLLRWHDTPGTRNMALYIGTTVLMVYLHYYGLLFLAAQWGYHLWHRKRGSSPKLVAVMGVVGAPAALWVSYRIYWAASSASQANVIGIPDRGPRQWVRMMLHPWLGQHLSMQLVNQSLRFVLPILIWIAVLGAYYAVTRLEVTRKVRLVAAWGGVPLGLLVIYTLVRKPILRPRYMAGVALAGYIAAAVATERLDTTRASLVAIVLLGGAVAGLPAAYADTGQMGWEPALSHVQQQAEEDDYVVVGSQLPKSPTYHLESQGMTADITTARVAEAVDWGDEQRDIWLLWRHPPSPAWENRGREMKQRAQSHGYTLEGRHVENKVVVYHFVKASDRNRLGDAGHSLAEEICYG